MLSTRSMGKVKNQVIEVFPLAAVSHTRDAGNPKRSPAIVINDENRGRTVQHKTEAIVDCWKAAMVSDARDPPDAARGADHLSTSFGGARALQFTIQSGPVGFRIIAP